MIRWFLLAALLMPLSAGADFYMGRAGLGQIEPFFSGDFENCNAACADSGGTCSFNEIGAPATCIAVGNPGNAGQSDPFGFVFTDHALWGTTPTQYCLNFDLTDAGTASNIFGMIQGSCSITTATKCISDNDCPGGETCEGEAFGYPRWNIDAGGDTLALDCNGSISSGLDFSAYKTFWTNWISTTGAGTLIDDSGLVATCDGADSATAIDGLQIGALFASAVRIDNVSAILGDCPRPAAYSGVDPETGDAARGFSMPTAGASLSDGGIVIVFVSNGETVSNLGICADQAGDHTCTNSENLTELADIHDNDTTSVNIAVYWKKEDATIPSNYLFSVEGDASTRKWGGGVVGFGGEFAGTPPIVSCVHYAASDCTSPSVTAPGFSRVLRFYAAAGSGTDAVSPPGTVLWENITVSGGSQQTTSSGILGATLGATATSTGTALFDYVGNNDSVCCTVAIPPSVEP